MAQGKQEPIRFLLFFTQGKHQDFDCSTKYFTDSEICEFFVAPPIGAERFILVTSVGSTYVALLGCLLVCHTQNFIGF